MEMQAQLYRSLNGAQPALMAQYRSADPAPKCAAGEIVLGTDDWTPGLQVRSEDNTEWIPVGSDLDKIRLRSTTDASLASTGHAFQIGTDSGANLIADGNEIMARNNGATATLGLNLDGGDVRIGDATSIVRFGVRTANADAPINGYLTIQDAGGTTRKLAIIA